MGPDQEILDAGVGPELVLQRRADASTAVSRAAAAGLSCHLDGDQVWETYSLVMAELRRGPILGDVDRTLS